MSDVDEGSSEDDIWENLPSRKHHVRGLGTKSKRTEVVDQTRAEGSTWKDATDAFQLVVSEWVKEIHSKWGGQFGATHRLGYGGGKNGASGRCACDGRHCKLQDAKCKVGLEVKWRNPNDKTCVKIIYWNTDHNLDCPTVSGTQDEPLRKSNALIKHLIHSGGSTSSMGNVLKMAGLTALHAGQASTLQNSMIANQEGRLSKDQAKKWAREQSFDTLSQWLWSYQRLPNLVWQLRAAGHVCVLLTQPLSYKIEGVDSTEAREFVAIYLCPSAASEFYKNNRAKISSFDAAHTHGKFPGHQTSSVVRDSYNHNIRTSVMYCAGNERKVSWDLFTDGHCAYLPNTNLHIVDKTKGDYNS